MTPKPVVIVNPRSGPGRAEAALACVLARVFPGRSPEVIHTERAGHALEAARGIAPSCPMVVVVGGDGTVRETVTGLLEGLSRRGPLPPIGLVPTGTANVLAYELGIPEDAVKAAQILAGGRLRSVDAGVVRLLGPDRAGEVVRFFLCMAGAGFDAEVTRSYHAVRGRRSHPYKYLIHMLAGLLSFRIPRMRVEVDGKTLTTRAGSVVVANTRSYALRLALAALARPDDGVLDVCAFNGQTRIDLLRAIVEVFANRHMRNRKVLYGKGTRVLLQSERLVPVQLDGDFAGFLPAEVSLRPDAVRVVAP